MTRNAIDAAIACAREFIRRASVVPYNAQWQTETGKNSGALRRISLDLTRALAAMRKSQ